MGPRETAHSHAKNVYLQTPTQNAFVAIGTHWSLVTLQCSSRKRHGQLQTHNSVLCRKRGHPLLSLLLSCMKFSSHGRLSESRGCKRHVPTSILQLIRPLRKACNLLYPSRKASLNVVQAVRVQILHAIRQLIKLHLDLLLFCACLTVNFNVSTNQVVLQLGNAFNLRLVDHFSHLRQLHQLQIPKSPTRIQRPVQGQSVGHTQRESQAKRYLDWFKARPKGRMEVWHHPPLSLNKFPFQWLSGPCRGLRRA